MRILDEQVKPREKVPWQSPSFRDGAIAFVQAAGFFVALAIFEIFIEGWAVFSILGALWLAGYAIKLILSEPSEMFLTDHRLLFRKYLLRPRVTIIDRADITHVELFSGDDTIVLHGRDGEIHRTIMPGSAEELVRQLELPGVAWRSRVPPQVHNLTFIGVILVPIAAIIGMFALLIGVVPTMAQLPLKSGLRELIERIASWDGAVLVILSGGVLAFGMVVSLLLMVLVRRMILTADELRCLRCARHNPLWAGKDPRSPLCRSIIYRVVRALRLGFGRVFYGAFPDCSGAEPETFKPGELPED